MSETEQPVVTVQDMDALVEEMRAQRDLVEEKENELKALNKQLTALEQKAVQYLKALGRENFSSPHGTLYISQKWRVNLPKTDEDKAALFKHLEERGIFMQYATVNSNSLNSLFLEDWKDAMERGEGMDFRMPGIAEPKLYETLGMRKK